MVAASERSVSPSRQFIIYADDARLRGAISDVAEQLKQRTLSILREADGWKTPIIMNVQSPQANLPEVPAESLRFSQTGAGLKLQLDLVVGRDVRALEMRREILRAILLERIYRNQTDIAPGSAYVSPPDWLLDGLLARFDRIEPRAPPQMSLEQFLQQRPENLDAPARDLYRAGSLALVNVIVDLAPDQRGLAHYLDHVAHSSDDSLGDLEKPWRARLENLASQNIDLLPFKRSEERLAQALQMKIAGKETSLAELAKPNLSPAEKATLELTAENLVLAGARAHPLLRTIIGEYQQIARSLAAGKRKGAVERLNRLADTRRRLVRRMEQIDDYLNWFEATQMTASSGAFDDYLRAAHGTTEDRHRHDVIATYLDAIETQTER